MIKIGIIGENYQNDSCAFKAFLTPQYEGKITFVPILKSLNGGRPPIKKVLKLLPTDIQKYQLNALLFLLDLDKDAKRNECNQWIATIQKGVSVNSIFYLAVMELEALILADIEIFNKKYGIKKQYTKNPKFEDDPKKKLEIWTEKGKANAQYSVNDAEEIFKKLRFEVVYKNHFGDDSFQEFIDNFERTFKVKRNNFHF